MADHDAADRDGAARNLSDRDMSDDGLSEGVMDGTERDDDHDDFDGPQDERPSAAAPRSAAERAEPAHADGARADGGRAAPRRRSDASRARRSEMNGHVQLLAAPGYGQLLAREPLLRRAIPLLTIIFVLVIAAYRIAITLDHKARDEAQAQGEITLVASALASEMGRRAETSDQPLSDIFALSLPDGATQDGRLVALLEGGRITATSPFRTDLIGEPAAFLLGENQPMTTFGRRAGVMEVNSALGTQFATVHHISDQTASVAVTQSKQRVLTAWRDEMSTNAVLFMTTAGVIIVVVYAFYAQSARAQTADHIYGATSERIDTALSRGRCGLFDWDVARGRMFWTPSMFEVLGMEPRDELIGFREVAALVHPADGGLYEIAERQLNSNMKVLDRTLRMRHADGRWIWMRFRAELVHDDELGRPHLIGVALDTTEQKRLQELSATADMRLRDAIETVSEAFVLWDAQNRLVMCNTKYQEMHNLPDEAVAPGTPYTVVINAARQPVVSSHMISRSDGPDTERSYEAELAGGRWLQINERRTKDGGFVSVGTDITTLKTHEERLMESEKRLKANVVELKSARRTAENQTRQLAELAEKYAEEKNRAEDANKAKSEFLANMSHELRTPLNAIIGFSEIMKSEMFGSLGAPKYVEYTQDIHHSGSYLLGVINDILDMSRIEAGQVDLSMELVDLPELFNEATRIMTPIAAEKSINLVTEIAEDMRIEVDRRAMKQILLNLMSNAVKFTPNDGRVTTRAKLEKDAVVVAVEDNGIGIPARELARLGQPFVQVETQLTKTYQGSGLGLAIARSLTELHRGKMVIESEVGEGTTVTVRLPRKVA
ncbi:PAS domain-containing sensor histidine kinase [Acuticoccus yangtzensis]|uniref:PAS domain-containing sensor histidine kinase n=1 Tax=Acuticoccus yangtzensis TaxID=1443441 RepID=UPI000A79BDF1|nr:PAS domain-containing sensor histidine kinase [Acuticoccus yangtzensis]